MLESAIPKFCIMAHEEWGKAGCKCGLNKGQFSGHGLILNLTD